MAAPKNAPLKPAPNAVNPAIEAGHPVPETAAAQSTANADAVRMTRKFAIDDNIPMPARKAGPRVGGSMYPFADLGVGQSFFVGANDKVAEPWKTLTSLASRMTRAMHPKTFGTARVTENGVEGVRIWRTADTDQALKPQNKREGKKKLAQEAAEGDTSVTRPAPDFE